MLAATARRKRNHTHSNISPRFIASQTHVSAVRCSILTTLLFIWLSGERNEAVLDYAERAGLADKPGGKASTLGPAPLTNVAALSWRTLIITVLMFDLDQVRDHTSRDDFVSCPLRSASQTEF
jgi:hypothetical protein